MRGRALFIQLDIYKLRPSTRHTPPRDKMPYYHGGAARHCLRRRACRKSSRVRAMLGVLARPSFPRKARPPGPRTWQPLMTCAVPWVVAGPKTDSPVRACEAYARAT